jgi:hypothetical protein
VSSSQVDKPFDESNAVVSQTPDAPLDCESGQQATGVDQAVWSYRNEPTRGKNYTFTGHVRYVDGAEAERLRGELAVVIRDLLAWAATEQRAGQPDREVPDDRCS